LSLGDDKDGTKSLKSLVKPEVSGQGKFGEFWLLFTKHSPNLGDVMESCLWIRWLRPTALALMELVTWKALMVIFQPLGER